MAAARGHLRGAGFMEVSTPFVVEAVAVEPFIEPVPAGAGFVITSPELAMKRLVASGRRSIFQIAHVRRAGERSDRHAEEFHLVEWYRVGGTLAQLQADVAGLVAAVGAAVGAVVGERPAARCLPARWRTVGFAELWQTTTGAALPGLDDLDAIDGWLTRFRERLGLGLGLGSDGGPSSVEAVPGLDALARWTELFSLWSDVALDPWLGERAAAGEGIHMEGFPAPLAALARVNGDVGRRFESYAGGVELANGYDELRDPAEQRTRFERVNALRVRHGLDALPIDASFLAALRDPGLPECVGVALGLDRLVMLAAGAQRLSDIDPLG